MAFGVVAALAGCAPAPPVAQTPRVLTSMEAALNAHVETLASDAFAGREPGTVGEALTLDYLQGKLAAAGLQSGTHDPHNNWREPISYQHRGETHATYNLIARLPGTEPQAGAILLMAHWDHLGEGKQCRRSGKDRICNGAVDNATGLAMMIEIAHALASGPAMRRDVYFLASGGEEAGLQGAAAFVAEPPVPLEKFVGVFNLDSEGLAPSGAPAVVLSAPGPTGAAAFSALIAATARDQGVTLVAPTKSNEMFLRRQDGWVFDEAGIPAVIVSAAFADEVRLRDYLKRRYHRASDNADGVELGATADMVALHTALLRAAADPDMLPRQPVVQIPALAH